MTTHTATDIPTSRARRVDDEWQLSLDTNRAIHYTVRNVRYGAAFDASSPVVAELVRGRQVLLVMDDSVSRLYGSQIVGYLSQHTRFLGFTIISGAEADKTLGALEDVCRALAVQGLDRNGVVVAVGGGVVLDIAGAAASLYRRGVRYLRVPTTIVGAVDVAVGIKQAVNFEKGKNLLGAFYPPIAAVVDRAFFQSLSERAIACGIAEIIKMGLIRDRSLFVLLETHGKELLQSKFATPERIAVDIVVLAQAAMMDELEPNLFEEDLRRSVDFGHTFSPAMETASNYTLPHGEAVAIDMRISTAIAVMRRLCPLETLDRLCLLYRDTDLPLHHHTCTVETLNKGLEDARKHRAGNLNLVVPTSVGSGTFIQDVGLDELQIAATLTSPMRNTYRKDPGANARI